MTTESPSSVPRPDPAAAFAEAVLGLEDELDWELLGRLYCAEGGEDFFPPAQVEAIREAGLRFAADLGAVLPAVAGPLGPGGPASLYVGAGVAELIPALGEALVLGRRVVFQNLEGPEGDELKRALGAVAVIRAAPLEVLLGPLEDVVPEREAAFGHVWMTSVLTDPEAFPSLHDEAYGRADSGPVRPAVLEREHRLAKRLVARVIDRLEVPGILTTTDEELPFFEAAFLHRGLRLSAPKSARLSAIVGDPVRTSRVSIGVEPPEGGLI